MVQCTIPLLFHIFEVSLGTCNYSLTNDGFVWDTVFFTCTNVHLKISDDTKLLLKIAELEIQSVCHVPGHGIKELVHALHCQLNDALEKTEVCLYNTR